MALEQSFSCRLNETCQVTLLVTSDGTVTGTPTDITGWAMELVLHPLLNDGVVTKRYTTGGGITIVDGPGGRARCLIPLADVQTLGVGDWRYFWRRTDPGSEADPTVGVFTILPV